MKYYSSNLDFLNSLYASIKYFFEYNKNKKDRRKVTELIKSGEEFHTDEDKKILCDENISIEEKIKYLEEKHNEFELLKKMNDEENAKIEKDLCEDFSTALQEMKMHYYNYSIIKDGDVLALPYADNASFRKSLVFRNAVCNPVTEDFQAISWYELSQSEGKYYLEMALSNQDELEFCIITFDSVTTRTEVFNAMNTSVLENQWFYLSCVFEDILKKNEYAPDKINEEEKELLLLARAVSDIVLFPETAKHVEWDDEALEKFVSLARSLQIENITAEKIRKGRITQTHLCDVKYEVLWTFIYDKLVSSQKGYPSKIEKLCDKKLFDSTKRKKVTEIVRKAGFEGEYPDFYKHGAITKPVAINSYGMDYITFAEKDVTHYIKCVESFDDTMQITFICGFVSNKTRKVYNPDGFSAMFSAKGRRYFNTLCYSSDDEENDVESLAEAAVKISLLQRLTKDEKQKYSAGNFGYIKFFLFLFIFCSIGFGLLFSLGMMMFETVMLWIEKGSFSGAMAEVLSFPWVSFGVIAGVMFGALITLAMAIIKKFTR